MATNVKNLVEQQAGTPFIEQVAGREKGRMFELANDRITIGRSDDNDIVVATEAVSRYHAVIERVPEGYWLIRDNQSKNGVQVNGVQVEEHRLQGGDVVQVGTFVFRFNESSGDAGSSREFDEGEPEAAEPQMLGSVGLSDAGKKKPNRRVAIYSVVGLVLFAVWYISSGSPDDKKTAADATGDKAGQTATGDAASGSAKMAREAFTPAKDPDLGVKEVGNDGKKIAALEDPLLKSAEQEMLKLDWSNSSLKESEVFFRKGQREYLDKNFQRAIEDFQTALSLYRGHELASKYLQRAYAETEQAAKQNMEIGVKYFETLQYQRSIYHFTEVIALMAHKPNEPIVHEAEKYIEQAKRRMDAAELFP